MNTLHHVHQNLRKNDTILSEVGTLQGSFELLPIQQEFLASSYENEHHFNQSILLNISKELENDVIENAISQLVLQHDMLRAKFKKEEDVYLGIYSLEKPNLCIETLSSSDR